MTYALRFSLLVASILACASFGYSSDIETNIPRLVQQLGSDQFSDRKAATNALQQMGASAFPALARAAKSADREVTSRVVGILKHHLESSDKTTKAEAKKTLEQLAFGKHELAARLAKQSLKPAEPLMSIEDLRARLQAAQQIDFVAQARVKIDEARGAKEMKRLHNSMKSARESFEKTGVKRRFLESMEKMKADRKEFNKKRLAGLRKQAMLTRAELERLKQMLKRRMEQERKQ